jgi:hypothetical protein
MRFMTTVFAREDQGMPPKGLMDGIAQLGAEAAQAGVFVQMGGLTPSAAGSTIRQSRGKLSIIDGPYAEAKEVIGGFAIYETKTKEEAMAWAKRFMQLHIDHWPEWEGECEIRQMFVEGDGPKAR